VTSGRSRLLTAKLLVIVQVSVSLLLLVGAGLFLRSLRNLKNLDAGFQPEGVLTMRVDPGAMNYQGARLTNFWNEVMGRVAMLPGVRVAALSTLSPMSGRDRGVMIEIPGFAARAARDRAITLNHVSQEYFTTMGIAVRQGRSFTQRDNESAPKVALLNETAARFYFGDKSPIGAVIRFSRPYKAQPYEIVGVVRDSKHNNLREETPRLLYLPLLQPIDRLGNLTLAIRTGTRPSDLVDVIRNEIRTVGRDVLVADVATLAEQVNQSLIQERLVSILSGFFGLLALLLACVGLYGLMSYAVARRTHEIGIRVAVGAQRGDVVWMILRESMLLIIVGLVLGLLASFAATRLISSQLFGISPHDPLTIVGATLMLAAIALIASYLPARRATKIDPMVALRYE
jgi:predicted permease